MNEIILLNTFFMFLLFKCCLSVPFICLSSIYYSYCIRIQSRKLARMLNLSLSSRGKQQSLLFFPAIRRLLKTLL